MHRRLAPLVACVLLATGCSSGGSDQLQVVTNPVAATAPTSPASLKPAGLILPQTSAITAIATGGRTLAVALAQPSSVLLYNLDDLGASPRQVTLPGPVERLTPASGRLVASIPTTGELAEIALSSGQVTTIAVPGQPAAGTITGNQTIVAVRDRKAVEVLDGNTVAKTITGSLYSADDVVTTGDSTVVLDRLRTALFSVDLADGKLGEGLRAGEGATNAVADSYGRVLVTDTRGGALLAFSTDPLLLRQLYPVPGGVYGIAYDTKRDLAWVTLTERNEVVGYDIRGGEPSEKYRFPTVRQPNSVAVDDQTARVIVGSAAGEGTQVIQP